MKKSDRPVFISYTLEAPNGKIYTIGRYMHPSTEPEEAMEDFTKMGYKILLWKTKSSPFAKE